MPLSLIVIGVVLRVFYLRQPMRYDESVTYIAFAARPWGTVVGSYLLPNNHVLHTILVKLCVLAFGGAPWVLRLPAVLAGIGMIPLTFLVGRRLVGDAAAWLGTAVVATSAPLILYSTNARGYTMVSLATLVLLLLLLRLQERSSTADWIGVVVTTALGLWTIPVMLFPAGGLALWFAWSAAAGDTSDGRGDLRRMGIAILVTGLVTIVCYAPILLSAGLHPITGNPFVSGTGWQQFFGEMLIGIPMLWRNWRIGLPVFVVVPLIVLVAVGTVAARTGATRRVPISVAMYLWCAVLLLLTHRAPYIRVWLFLIPLLALLAGLGAVTLLTRFAQTNFAPAQAPGLALVTAIAFGAAVVASGAVPLSRDTGTLRDAAAITSALAPLLHPGDRVLAPVPSDVPLQYYFARAGLDTSYLSATPTPTGKVYLVVNLTEGMTVATPLRDPLAQRFTAAHLISAFPAAAAARPSEASAELYQLITPDGQTK